ncbi:MAG TPA: fimbria/pilus outer membrane usher protein [Anaeromyxobacter sp.]
MRRDVAWTALISAVLALTLLAARRAGAEEYTIDVKDPLVRIRAEFDLFLNGAPAGTALVVLERGDALVLPEDLERAGLKAPGGRRVTIDDRALLSLRSLEPGVRFVVDERALAVRITADPALLGRHTLDLRPQARPREVEQRFDRSAFLDYAADSDLAGGIGLAFQGGGRVGRWLALTDVSRSIADGRWLRGTTAAIRDDVPSLQRWTVGDTVASTGTLGGGVAVAGITFARELSLDPYLVRAPFPATSALVGAPSTLEVYVNGAMVRQQPLAPGYWTLANLPATSGQSFVHTVVRDAFGHEQSIDNRFYFSSGLLAPGYSDYAVTAGLRRRTFGEDWFDYGGPAASARYRWGASDWLTPDLRAEASSDVVSGGGGATMGSRFGELLLEGAASAAGGRGGGAALVGWSWTSQPLSTALRLAGQTDRYAHLALPPEADRPVLDARASFDLTVARRVGLGLDLRGGRFRDLGDFAAGGVRASVQLGGVMLTVSGDYGNDVGGRTGVQAYAVLSWRQGVHSGDASVTRDRDGRVVESASAGRPLARDSNVGYRVHASGDDRDRAVDGSLQGQSSFGRAELRAASADGVTTWRAHAEGGLVYVDGGAYLSRPTADGFALVDAGGIPGVGVTVENVLAGRTGANGKLLVTELQPYYASRLALLDRDVPAEYEPGRTAGWFAPPLRGGAIARFDVRRISALAGQLAVQVRGKDARPANGELSVIVDGDLRTSPITDEGRFFLERMPPGKHVLQAVWGGGSCRAVVTLPERAPPVFDAGELRCILDALDPAGRLPSLRDPGYGAVPPDGETGAGSGGR